MQYTVPNGGNFTFITVRAAGHMVSQAQPIFGERRVRVIARDVAPCLRPP